MYYKSMRAKKIFLTPSPHPSPPLPPEDSQNKPGVDFESLYAISPLCQRYPQSCLHCDF